jgi:16S rRNA (guanine527-N7)-methyltransferase
MRPEQVLAVGPYAGSRHRHLHVMRKAAPTPEHLPRRPGMAKKRPFGSRRGDV